jgi:mono/diheme cytochrome c family protein
MPHLSELHGAATHLAVIAIDGGGQLARTAVGARRLAVALASDDSPVSAGRAAFSAQGLGCALCHGDRAQGMRGPSLAGGAELAQFRRKHAHGLFPPSVVTDRDFAAVDAWLRTLPAGAG